MLLAERKKSRLPNRTRKAFLLLANGLKTPPPRPFLEHPSSISSIYSTITSLDSAYTHSSIYKVYTVHRQPEGERGETERTAGSLAESTRITYEWNIERSQAAVQFE